MLPRQVLPGTSYLITRRCVQRQFWLRPSPHTNQIVMYCVAVAAARYEMQVHAMCVMSNHWHAVVTDPKARLPAFLQWVHEYVAKCINASYRRSENMWATEPPSAVRLEGNEDVLDKVAYCLANPVSAGLVAYGHEWPGVRTSPREVAGSERVIARPTGFFRKNGTMPESAVLRIVRPGIYGELSDGELADRVEALVSKREAAVRKEHRRQRRGFLGAQAVLQQRPDDSAVTPEQQGELSPRVAAKNKWLRMEALQRLKSFVDGYAEALRAWRAGIRDVVFPAGTYAMRVRHCVACAMAPP
jgi:REP element-mobilizing transposase RayT